MKRYKYLFIIIIAFTIIFISFYYITSTLRVRSFIAETSSYYNTQKGIYSENDIQWLEFPISHQLDEGGVPDDLKDVTHPSLVYRNVDGSPDSMVIALSPYPQSICGEDYENTCVYTASYTNGEISNIKNACRNPIIVKEGAMYNSDPEIFYDDADSMYYCVTRKRHIGNVETRIVMQSSSDCKKWTEPVTLFETDRSSLCPCLLKVDSLYYIYLFNTKDYVSPCENQEVWVSNSLTNPNFELKGIYQWKNQDIAFWHGDVLYHKGVYYLTCCGINMQYKYPWGSLDHGKYLWFAKSTDGVDWSFCESPILKKNGVYRSTLDIDNDENLILMFSVSWRNFDSSHKSGNMIGYIVKPLQELESYIR